MKIRKKKNDKRDEEEQDDKYRRIDAFREQMNRHKRGMENMHDEEFEFMKHQMPRKPRKKKSPLRYLKDVNWNAYDKTLTANFKNYRADEEPKEEE